MDDKTLTFTASAQKNLDNMIHHSQLISSWYGAGSSVAVKAMDSLNSVLSGMIRLGGKIYADGDGLGGVTDYGFVYGIVFHPSALPDEFQQYENLPDRPVTGTWSINS